MPRVTASALRLLPFCGYSFRSDVESPPDPMGPKARVGTATHALNEALLKGTLGVSYYPQDAIVAHRIPGSEIQRVYAMHDRYREWYESSGCPKLEAEVPYVFDVTTRACCRSEVSGQRGYAYKDGSVYGTADAISAGDELIVYDVKTGRSDTVERARNNKQLAFLGLAAARTHGYDSVRVVLQFLDADGLYPDEATLDYFSLEDFENWLVERYSVIETEPPQRGEWCSSKYCKLRPRGQWKGCPAWEET